MIINKLKRGYYNLKFSLTHRVYRLDTHLDTRSIVKIISVLVGLLPILP